MKKITYISIGLIIAIFVLFQPVQNFYLENQRIEREAFIDEFLASKQILSYKDSKKLPKALRPDLKGAHDYLMMYDLNTGTIPTERILNAIDEAEEKRTSSMYSKKMTEVNWIERGPNTIGGRTRALLLDPNDSSNKKLWAAGVSGGLWYTNDITSSNPDWNSVDGTWGNLAVCSINYDPNDTNIMYVGTGERMGIFSTASRGLGLWKTTDGGVTWSHLSSTENFNYVTDILVRNEGGSSVVYIGVGGHRYEGKWHGSEYTGLWRSTDGGATWSQVMDTASTDGDAYEIMDLDMGSDNKIWAASRTNVYGNGGGDIFSSDDGLNWTKASISFLGSPNRTIIAVAPSDPNYVYAMIASSDTRKIQWIVKTVDGGANWTTYTAGTSDPFPVDDNGNVLGDANGQAGYDLSLGVDPNDPNILYAGELDVFKSTDGGDSWIQVSNSGGSTYPYMHVDQQNLKTVTSNEIIFSNDGGVYYTNDAGATLADRNTGYNVSQFYSVALHPDAGSEYVIGGTQDNGTWTIGGTGIGDGNAVVGGDGAYTHIDQVDPNYQFTATTYNNIYRSTNGGSTWSYYANHETSDGGDTGFFINPSTIDGNTQTFYSALDATSILKLRNYATLADKSVMQVSLGSTASAFKISPHSSDVLFVGTSAGRIFKISDASTSSYTVEEIGGSGMQGYISSIDIGASDNQILATISNYGAVSVWETVGGGGSNGWTDIEGDLSDMPVRWGLYNPENYNQVILATELGTWVSDDVTAASPTWYPSNDGLANVRTDMLVRRSSDNALAAGTHGRGIFYSTGFTSTAPLNAAFTPDKLSGVFPLTVNFSDRSTGNVSSWLWDFGDGNTSTEQSPSHTFQSSGRYSVSLQVSDGSSTDNVAKSNLIWVTAQQDTLWEEGFETNPYGWADNRRDVHAFSYFDENNDSDSWSWWYYTAGFGAADGSHWMAGLGMNSSATADDWLVSPELWLRPGTDNLIKFYTNMNGGEENYSVMLSPTGSALPENFTVTLDTVTEAVGAWTERSYDLTQYAGTKVRVAIHVYTAGQGYAFFDNFTLTAGQLDSAGSPLAPQGVTVGAELEYDSTNSVWTPSLDKIGLYWNRNLEDDFASYNVYGSQTESFTADGSTLLGQGTLGNIDSEHLEPSPSSSPWADTTFVFRQTFGVDSYIHEGLSQGDTWYYKVGAVDNDGNETVGSEVSFLLDSSGPTAGTVTLNDIYDSSYLRSTSEVSITVDGWSDNTGISAYFMGIGSSGDDNSADIVAYKNVGLTNLQLTDLTLDDFTTYYLKVVALDGADNQSSFVIKEFNTYTSLLGDSDSDWDVDVTDLNAFVSAWPNVDIGPASGASPYPMPSLDGTADINDISVFSRNWLWTKAQGRIAQESQEIIPIEFDAEVVGNQIIIELPQGITAGRFELSNLNNIYTFKASNKEGYMVLENTDQENQYYEFEFGNLSSNDNQLIITVEGAAITNDIELNYQLFSKDGLAGNGMVQLSNPDEFKLYQNYPNPFNNQTTIKYDIPSMMVNMVDVEIHIYNTLGKLVKTIDEGDKSVGQYTTIWDGKNDDGDKVSSGVYFYQLRVKVDGQSDYNKTMKMVIVR